jgi:hypothetical protein
MAQVCIFDCLVKILSADVTLFLAGCEDDLVNASADEDFATNLSEEVAVGLIGPMPPLEVDLTVLDSRDNSRSELGYENMPGNEACFK